MTTTQKRSSAVLDALRASTLSLRELSERTGIPVPTLYVLKRREEPLQRETKAITALAAVLLPADSPYRNGGCTEETSDLVPVVEAARILGLSAGTVRTMMDTGVLKTVTFAKRRFVARRTLQQIMPHAAALQDTEADMERVRAALRERRRAVIHTEYDALARHTTRVSEALRKDLGIETLAVACDTCRDLFDAFVLASENNPNPAMTLAFTEREKEIVRLRIRGYTLDHIGMLCDLTPEGARRTYLRALAKGRQLLRTADLLTGYQKEIDRLRAALDERQRKDAEAAAAKEEARYAFANGMTPATRLKDSGLSPRLWHTLTRNDVFTISQLDALPREEIRKMRGLGGKSLAEADAFLRDLGLEPIFKTR